MGEDIAFVNEPKSKQSEKRNEDHSTGAKPKPKTPGRAREEAMESQAVSVGSKDQATFFNDGVGDTVANGEAGFSRRMLMETNAAANAMDWEGLELRNVVPAVNMAHWQIRQRSREKVEQEEKTKHADGSTRDIYTTAEAWCLEHGTQIKSDITEEQATFVAYNSWVPRANGFFSSLMRLRAQQKMLGARDTDALVQQLTKGLGEVSHVAARMQLSHDRGHAPTLQVPVVDGTLDQAAGEATHAGRTMRTDYLSFQQALLAEEKTAANHEGYKDSARLEQINTNKTFVRNAGKTIDMAMSVVDGAPANIATVTNTINNTGAVLGAAANKRQIMNGQRPTHNPTYVTTDAAGNTVVRNVQTGMDRGMEAKAGEAYAHTPTPESGFALPTNVSDVLGQIVDFAYAGEVAKINFHLEEIKTRCDIIQSVSDAIITKARIQTFQDTLNGFAIKCNELQKRMEARRQQYLEFGIQLDNFARTDFGSQKAGLSPGKEEERYATVMTVVSTVREVVSMGRGAASASQSTSQLKPWIQGIYDHRERTDDGRSDIQWMKMPGDELQRLVDMYNQVQHFEDTVELENKRLGPVDDLAMQYLAKLTQGSGGSSSGGRY